MNIYELQNLILSGLTLIHICLQFTQLKQGAQCTYNITLRCVRVTTVAVEK